MTKQEGILLFYSMHPDFFERETIRNISEDWIYEEMVLSLDKFDPYKYNRKLDKNISFGYYQGDISKIKKAVEEVD